MKRTSVFSTGVLMMAGTLFLAVASGQERPVRRNRDYNPEATAAASSFNSFNLGVNLKITGASIAKDGTVTAQFTLTDSAGAGLDNAGILTAGPVSLSFVAVPRARLCGHGESTGIGPDVHVCAVTGRALSARAVDYPLQ